MKHLAIIADGNRRWAKNNGFSSELGYVQGLVAIERSCEWAIQNEVQHLTVYCFSTENWERPQHEVDYIMNLARQYFEERREWYVARGIKVRFAGRRDRLDRDIVEKLVELEKATIKGQSMVLTICVDYGGRDEIARTIAAGARTEEEINELLCNEIPEPDVIFRTGGQYRLSNFLLWQSAYSELFFDEILFPDLDSSKLNEILNEYQKRARNFGK